MRLLEKFGERDEPRLSTVTRKHAGKERPCWRQKHGVRLRAQSKPTNAPAPLSGGGPCHPDGWESSQTSKPGACWEMRAEEPQKAARQRVSGPGREQRAPLLSGSPPSPSLASETSGFSLPGELGVPRFPPSFPAEPPSFSAISASHFP